MTSVSPPGSRTAPGDSLHARLEKACAHLDPPFAVVDLDAFDANHAALVGRAGGVPIRLASKSLRCRALLERTLAQRAGAFRGLLVLTVREALWLTAAGFEDVVVGYPSADRAALAALVALAGSGKTAGTTGTGGPGESGARRRVPTVMVDAVEHLDLLQEAGAGLQAPVDVCLDADASLWLLGGRVRIGPRRSPLHDPDSAAAMAREVVRRPGLRLRGMMAYEGQIAGVGDRPPGRPLRAVAIRAMQAASRRELRARRAALVAAVEAEAGPLEFVNAGGTGSLESSSAESAVTEVTAGSGLFAPALFDSYRRFAPQPAAFFALPVVRRPGPGTITALGGGYIASGPAGADRLPVPWLPRGLRLDREEGAGETQTPLRGAAADRLVIGDRVWMRHAKAGELCERFDRLHLIAGDQIIDDVPTYRGDGQCVL